MQQLQKAACLASSPQARQPLIKRSFSQATPNRKPATPPRFEPFEGGALMLCSIAAKNVIDMHQTEHKCKIAFWPDLPLVHVQALHTSHTPTQPAGELDLNQFQVSPTRRRIATFFRVALPLSAGSCLIYAFTHPDEDQGFRMPPELQYLAAQQAENENTLMNWSATHEARPK